MNRYIVDEKIDLEGLIASTEDIESGALAIFVGTVRAENEGARVLGITYEAARGLAAKVLAEIEERAGERFDIRRCRIVHRVGDLALGETSVAIVIRSAHRDAAFRALRFAIDETKARAPIWKLEHYADGHARYLEGSSLVTVPRR